MVNDVISFFLNTFQYYGPLCLPCTARRPTIGAGQPEPDFVQNVIFGVLAQVN